MKQEWTVDDLSDDSLLDALEMWRTGSSAIEIYEFLCEDIYTSDNAEYLSNDDRAQAESDVEFIIELARGDF